jgi:hypothetical protein
MMTRREFAIAATLAAAEWTAFKASAAKPVAPNSKLCHACIGVGGMGWGDFNSFKSHPGTQIVALCDVDKDNLAKAAALIPGVRTYSDWREMFAKEGGRIDSVNVSVPDHNHAVIAAAALRLGKHVYCQKPLCHEISDCRLLRDLAKAKGVTSQLGTQFAAGKGDRMAVAYLKNGVLGTIQRVCLFSIRNGISRTVFDRPPQPAPVPESLNWEVWLGTAPFRPYAPKVYHPLLWRVWQQFGSSWIGDVGCHMYSAPWRGLGLSEALTVRAEVQESWRNDAARRRDFWPQGAHIVWQHPGVSATDGKPLTVEWFDGFASNPATPAKFLPPPELTGLAKQLGFEKLPEEGAVVEGSEGWLLLPHGNAPRIVMKKPGAALPPKPQLPDAPSHYHEFLDACREGRPASADFSASVPMVETVLLGNIAERFPDTELAWDVAAMRVKNADAPNQYLRRAYRKGWEMSRDPS